MDEHTVIDTVRGWRQYVAESICLARAHRNPELLDRAFGLLAKIDGTLVELEAARQAEQRAASKATTSPTAARVIDWLESRP